MSLAETKLKRIFYVFYIPNLQLLRGYEDNFIHSPEISIRIHHLERIKTRNSGVAIVIDIEGRVTD